MPGSKRAHSMMQILSWKTNLKVHEREVKDKKEREEKVMYIEGKEWNLIKLIMLSTLRNQQR